MPSSVTLPTWLVIAAGLLAVVGLLDRLLVPTLRWFLRRRLNRAIEQLNSRLKLKIPAFKLARRRVLIDNLLFDPDVLRAVEGEAAARGEPHEVVLARAKRYAREIVPSFSAYAYFGFAMGLAKRVSRFLYRVRLGAIDEAALSRIEPNASVVFVINHRSNMDYVLVTYMVSTSSALSYAVGEWARVWLLQGFIRSMGGYFVRRDSSSNKLYRKVLARYVQMATAAGVAQAVFPEGGLSRDGALQRPKLGLLSYIVSGFDINGARDIVFVPVGLSYDRVLEDRVLTAAAASAAAASAAASGTAKAAAVGKDAAPARDRARQKAKRPRFAFNPWIFLRFIGRNLWLRLRGRWYRYGYAAVGFGRPVSLREHLKNRAVDLRNLPDERRFAEIERLGMRLMSEVGEVVPALPVSMVARALLLAGEAGLSGLELKGAIYNMMQSLKARGAHVHMPRKDLEYALSVGLRQLTLRHLVEERDGIYRANAAEIVLLTYYANAIAHLFPMAARTSGEQSYGEGEGRDGAGEAEREG